MIATLTTPAHAAAPSLSTSFLKAAVSSAVVTDATSSDITLTLNASDIGADPDALRAIVPAMQEEVASAGHLSEALKREIADNSVNTTTVDTSNWPIFDGSVGVTPDGIAVDIPTTQIGASATFWQWVAATTVGWLAGYGLRVLCIAALTASGVGAAIIPLVCTPLQGAVTGIITAIMKHGFDHDLGSPQATRDIIIGGLLGLAGGVLWEKYLSPWAKGNLARHVKDLGTWLRGKVPWLASRFGSAVGEEADAVGTQLEELTDLLNEAMRDWGGEGGLSNPGGPFNVMVVGDSMSQGREGDWTWRYRLWQWFTSQGVDVHFVGPYTGTREPDAAAPPTPPLLQGDVAASSGEVRAAGGYAEGAFPFDSHHFAVWGRQAAQDKKLIRAAVALYQPDLLLVGLGFNDMGWFVSDAQGTLDSMKTLVDEARAAKSNIDIALANVPQRTYIGGRDDLPVKTTIYNAKLKAAIPSWSTITSPVKLVDWAGNYNCGVDSCPAGYDGLHPNALGEYQIAQAYERTLHDGWGIGHSVPDVPTAILARPTPVPGNVMAAPTALGITVTWDKVYGARSYTVRSRVAGFDWTETSVSANRFDTSWTLDGWQWEYQVRTDNGTDGQSDWSPIVTAVAHPQTAPPPVGIVTNATATGLDVAWGAPTGPYTDTIDRYQIIIWDKDTPGAYIGGTAVQALSAHIDGLLPGHRYQVWVATWNAAGGGFPGSARPVTIGAGTPLAPTGLRETSVDGTTVRLSWFPSSGAAEYRIWVRNITNGSVSAVDENATTMDTGTSVAFLFPGVWNYEFCVTAVNGAAESNKSPCVVASRPPGA